MNDRHRILRLIALLSGNSHWSDEEAFERFRKAYEHLSNSSDPDVQKFYQDFFPEGRPSADDFLIILSSWLLPRNTPPS